MNATGSAQRTLLEDWRARRERLAEAPSTPGGVERIHLQILDYLIHRYADAPEAQRPARFSPRGGLHVDERTIVVHHHLYQGRVAGVKSRKEAEDRVATIVHRMAADEDVQADPEGTFQQSDEAAEQEFHATDTPRPDPVVWQETLFQIRRDRRADAAIDRALRRGGITPVEVVRHLHARVTDPSRKDVLAARLLVRCNHPRAASYAVLAWQGRLRKGLLDDVTERLVELIRDATRTQEVLDAHRNALADSHAVVRLASLEIIGRCGALDDIGLLSDLLALPSQEDEDPKERETLAWAMRQIAERGET